MNTVYLRASEGWKRFGLALRDGQPVPVLVVVRNPGDARAIYADSLQSVPGRFDDGTGWFGSTAEELRELVARCAVGECPAPALHCDAQRLAAAARSAIKSGRWEPVRLVSPADEATSARVAMNAVIARVQNLVRTDTIGLVEVAACDMAFADAEPDWWHSHGVLQNAIEDLRRQRDALRAASAPEAVLGAIDGIAEEWQREMEAIRKAAAVYKARAVLHSEHKFYPVNWVRESALTNEEWERIHHILAYNGIHLWMLARAVDTQPDHRQWPAWMWTDEQVRSATAEQISDNLVGAVTGLMRDPYRIWEDKRVLLRAARLAPRGTRSRRVVSAAIFRWRRLAEVVSKAYEAANADGDVKKRRHRAQRLLTKAGFDAALAKAAARKMTEAPPPGSPFETMRELATAIDFG